MFASSEIDSFVFTKFNTNKVKNMSHMFCNCSLLTNLNLLNIVTNSVEDISGLFSGCTSLLSLNLSSFDTSKVKNMSAMFENLIFIN